MNKSKKVIIRRYDGVYCIVLVRKNPANPAHWVFDVTVTPVIGGRCDYTFKRYACGNYYWVDGFWGYSSRACIKLWFPAWNLRKILSAAPDEVIE